MKVTVDEIARFMKDGWPQPADDWYIDDNNDDLWMLYLSAEDYSPKVPGTVVNDADFECYVSFQGTGEDPTRGDGYSWLRLFRAWRKKQSTTVIVVDAPNDKVEDIRRAIQAAGGKVTN